MSEKRPSKNRSALSEIATIQSSISRLTGWSPQFDELRVEVVSEPQFVRRVALDDIRRTGIPRRGIRSQEMGVRYLHSENLICSANYLATVSEEDAERGLFLSLVRAAQRQVYGDFFLTTDTLSREAWQMKFHGADIPTDERVRRCSVAQNELQARLSFADAHASVLYVAYAQQVGLSANLWEATLQGAALLVEGSESRLSHYVSSLMVVNEIASRFPDLIDALYSSPALVEQAFGETVPTVSDKERFSEGSSRPAV